MPRSCHAPWLAPSSAACCSSEIKRNLPASTVPSHQYLRSSHASYDPRAKPNTPPSSRGPNMLPVYALFYTTWAIPNPPRLYCLCDNTTAIGLANDIIKQKRSKAIIYRYAVSLGARFRIRQNQFCVIYIPTQENIADYMTKNLPKELHNRFTFYLVRNTVNKAHCFIALRRL
jgi:hypothetical protein